MTATARMTATGDAPRVGLVLLAAGAGRRMGSAANKLLLDLNGAPVVRRAALPLIAALDPGAPRVVVIGRDGAQVAAALDGLGFMPVRNPRPEDGMGASVAVGVAALPADGLDAVMIALGDMPDVAPDTVQAMVAALGAQPDPTAAILRPTFNGHPGNPVLWGAGFRSALMALTGDRGGRDLIRAHGRHLRTVIVDDPAVIRDIDRPADLDAARAEKRWS